MVPLYFYENTIFVMTTEPTDTNWSFPVQYVLGSPEQLKYFWEKLQGIEEEVMPIINMDETTRAEAASAEQEKPHEPIDEPSPNESAGPQELISFEDTPEDSEPEMELNRPHDMPSTNTIKSLKDITVPDSVRVESLNSQMNKVNSSAMEKPAANEETETSLNLNFNTQASSPAAAGGFEELETQYKINLEDDKTKEDIFTGGFEDVDSKNGTDILEGLTGLEELTQSSSNPASSTEVMEGLNFASSEMGENTLMGMPSLSTTTKSMRLNQAVEPAKDKSEPAEHIPEPDFQAAKANTEPAEPITSSEPINPVNMLQKVNKYFKQSLIFELSNNQVSLFEQDGTWDLADLEPIELTKTPSLFNFCLISKLPFHGAISNNDSLKHELFQKLKISNKDEHITLMPIMNEDNINHFILATGDKQNLKHLTELEKTVPDFLRAITA